MAQLPNPADLPRRQLGVGPAAQSYASGVEGTALANAGKSLAIGLNDLGKLVKAEQDEIDKTVAQDALNNLQRDALHLKNGDGQENGEVGYSSLKGAQAVLPGPDGKGIMARYDEKFKAKREAYAAKLSNNQRLLYDEAADKLGLEFYAGVALHAAREKAAYQATVDEGQIAVLKQQAATNYNSPEEVIRAANGVSAVAARVAQVGGEQAGAAYKKHHASEIFETAVGKLLAEGKTRDAALLYGVALGRGEMVDANGTLAKAIKGKSEDDEAYNLAVQLFDARKKQEGWVANTSDLFNDARKRKLTPEVMKKVMFEASNLVQMDNAAETARLTSFDNAIIFGGKTLQDVESTPEFLALPKDEQIIFHNRYSEENPKSVDYRQIEMFDRLVSQPGVLASMSRPQVLLYAKKHNLNRGYTEALLSAHSRKPSELDTENIEMRAALLAAGMDILKESDEDYVKLRVYMRKALSTFVAKNGRAPTREEREKLYSDALASVPQKNKYLGFIDGSELRYKLPQ